MKKKNLEPLQEEQDTVLDYPEEAEDEEFDEFDEFDEFEEFVRPPLSFSQKLIIYIAAWVVVTLAACGVMWNVMQQYEAAQPWYAVEDYITTSGQSAFFSALNKAHPNAENHYESLYEIAGVLSSKYTGKISYKKMIREYTYENPVYLLYSGEENLMKITLEQSEKTGFLGLLGYRVASVELVATDILSFSSYGLVVPENATVYINGKTLHANDVAESEAVHVFGAEGYRTYLLENFFTRPTVKVKLNGKDLSPVADGHFIYDYPTPKLRTLRIIAPKNATIRIDGERVSDFFITGTDTSDPDCFGATTAMTCYTVPTVAGKGVVTVTQDGKGLQTETVNEYVSAEPLTESVTVRIPPTAVLYANGTAVETKYVTDMHAPLLSDFAEVRGYPEAHTYVIDGLHALPVFTATDGGAELIATDDDGVTVFVNAASEALGEAYRAQAVAFMNAYLYYTTQGYSNTRRNLNAVKDLVANPSPLYTNLERSYVGYSWIAPQAMTVETMTVDNFVPYGENAFTCDLYYKIAFSNWVGEATDESTMRIAFAKQANGAFLPVNMVLLGK